jgi:uncharacterized protein (DUF2235 family)
MAKNIVVCCDGTGNEVKENLSNVLKLYRIAERNAEQVVFYDPGVGTLSSDDPWSRLKSKASQVFGLATGYGLDENVLDAYRFLVDTYEHDDKIFLFGFSRGAYTVRVLAGFLRMVGLVEKPQRNLADYALTAYKKAATRNDFQIAWRFERVIATRPVPLWFVGVWDTVSSVIVPRPDRFYIPSTIDLPYTKTNEYVRVLRHALAIDERRRMFRPSLWTEGKQFKPRQPGKAEGEPQDVKQVWFAGVHSDVGGGYPEKESGLAKFPLCWMVDEARAHGLLVNESMYGHLALGKPRPGGEQSYVAPDATAQQHDSMTLGWRLIDWAPKPRSIPDGARIHWSVIERRAKDPKYQALNLPSDTIVEGIGAVPGDPPPLKEASGRDSVTNRAA